jgi:hypothetical protein
MKKISVLAVILCFWVNSTFAATAAPRILPTPEPSATPTAAPTATPTSTPTPAPTATPYHPTWIQCNERNYAEGCAGHSDVVNRPAKEFWAVFLIEHNPDGTHKTGLTPTATPEPGATATPEPGATATPEPEATATPEPEATATPEPEATATPGGYAIHILSDTTEGSTAFVDSAMGKTITANGDAHHTTSKHVIGASSIALDGNGDYLLSPYSADWDVGSGDFTIETMAYFSAVNAEQGIIAYNAAGANGGYVLALNSSGALGLWINLGGSWQEVGFIAYPSSGAWHHLAATRYGNVFRVFLDGSPAFASLSGSLSQTASNTPLTIGAKENGGGSFLNGYLDSIRVTKGFARYTGAFTSPVPTPQPTPTP